MMKRIATLILFSAMLMPVVAEENSEMVADEAPAQGHIDMDNGVEHHGTLARCDSVRFNFMCAVLDVEEMELQHRMIHAIDDSGMDYHIDKESLKHHHHDHDHEHGHEDHEHHHHH